LTRDFRKLLKKADIHEDMFFQKSRPGRKEKDKEGNITGLIVNLRKEGFARLPRRSNQARKIHDTQKIKAPESIPLLYLSEKFSTVNSIGILCLIPASLIIAIQT